MNSNNVNEKIYDIFMKLFDINLSTISNELFNKNLLGDAFCFEPVDLLCLYMEVEKEFKISIPKECVIENKFTTINNIKEIINTELKENMLVANNG